MADWDEDTLEKETDKLVVQYFQWSCLVLNEWGYCTYLEGSSVFGLWVRPLGCKFVSGSYLSIWVFKNPTTRFTTRPEGCNSTLNWLFSNQRFCLDFQIVWDTEIVSHFLVGMEYWLFHYHQGVFSVNTSQIFSNEYNFQNRGAFKISEHSNLVVVLPSPSQNDPRSPFPTLRCHSRPKTTCRTSLQANTPCSAARSSPALFQDKLSDQTRREWTLPDLRWR